ncbi:hypothetical protein M758_9G021900 [Ceratodon purpureus]|nr:hypothetical protein M758_9G021900 [Ceratodon purpureus]
MYSMQDGQRYDFSTMYSTHGDGFPGRSTMHDDRKDSFPPRHSMHDDRRDSFPPRQSMQGGRGDGFLTRHASFQDDRRDEFSSRYTTQDGRGDDILGRHSMQDGGRDSFSGGNKGFGLAEGPPSPGWTSSIVNPISSLVTSFWSRDSKAGAEGSIRDMPKIQRPPAYYSGHDSGYSGQSYHDSSMDYGSRDLNSSKPDSTLAIYGSREITGSHLGKPDNTLAIYDPQLGVAREKIKELESILAEREGRIDDLDSSLKEKKTFIEHMEKDFREVTKSSYLKEMSVRDLEAKEAAYQVRMKEKEQEVKGLLERLERAEDESTAKDAKIKELQSSLQDVRRESQQLKAWKIEQEERRKLDEIDAEELNLKIADLTSANFMLESKKQQLTTHTKEQMKLVQDLRQQTSAQEAMLQAKDLEVQSLRDRLREEQETSSKLSEQMHKIGSELEQKDAEIEQLCQLVEELDQHSLSLQAQLSTTDREGHTDDHEQLKAHCSSLEEKVESHSSMIENLRARLREEWDTTSNLNERLQQRDLEIDDLKNQIQDLQKKDSPSDDFIQAPKELIRRDTFLGSQATPNLLNVAVQRVHEVAGIFARLLMKASEQGKIDGMAVARNNFVRAMSLGKAAPLKYVLEAITCKLLFHGFEHECFDLQDSSSGFLDVEQQRIENFRQYKYLTSIENTEQLVHSGDGLFADFCRIKLEDLSDTIPEIAGMMKEMMGITFERSASPDESSTEVATYLAAKLGATFVQLAVCVWQVHKLAFSFNPVARIFRVAQSEKFVEKYMESVIFQESESDDDEDMPSSDISRVDFMVVPGFLINKSVVRSRVFVVTKSVTNSVRLPIRTS